MKPDPKEPQVSERTATFDLRFSDGPFDEDHAVHDLSTLAPDGEWLWTAADERAAVERFRRQSDGSFAEHRSIDLAALLPLPDGDGEMDIEGMDIDGGRLWVVGSHSLRRLKADPEEEADYDHLRDRLAVLDRQPNRYTLACLPLGQFGDDGPLPVIEAENGKARAAALPWTRRGNRLTKALRRDPHIAPFLRLPAKENGLDIEGLAVAGGRVLLGLRGPVLRGWAVVLELRVTVRGNRIKLARFSEETRYRKHLLDLGGLGIRDMTKVGDDVLILAGPSMDHAGRTAIFRWKKALRLEAPAMEAGVSLAHVIELPSPAHVDRAEGVFATPQPDGRIEVGVIYDRPARRRLDSRKAIVRGDVFEF